MAQRIAELSISGVRTIEELHLPLDRLTVLIGDNGAGKSTIIEAAQILRSAGRPDFLGTFHTTHGGMFGLLRRGARRLTLGVTIRDDATPSSLRYELVLHEEEGGAVIHGESLRAEDGTLILERDRNEVRIGTEIFARYLGGETALAASGTLGMDPRVSHARAALESIEVHVAFETMPIWAARARSRAPSIRSALPIQRTSRVSLLGDNLPNVYYALKNDGKHWQSTLELVRLGLGEDIENVKIEIDPGGGAISLALEVRGIGSVFASQLSDGQLAYLAFVGLYRLDSGRSLVAFDEPELHLHPALIARVAQFFEGMSEKAPVLLATHSDALLDSFSNPASAVRVCELSEPRRATVVRSLDEPTLARWLRDYRGVGHIRSDGFLSQIVQE
jgi:predicted ATPase